MLYNSKIDPRIISITNIKSKDTYWRITRPLRASSWSTILFTVSRMRSTAALASRRFSNSLTKTSNKISFFFLFLL